MSKELHLKIFIKNVFFCELYDNFTYKYLEYQESTDLKVGIALSRHFLKKSLAEF